MPKSQLVVGVLNATELSNFWHGRVVPETAILSDGLPMSRYEPQGGIIVLLIIAVGIVMMVVKIKIFCTVMIVMIAVLTTRHVLFCQRITYTIFAASVIRPSECGM